jgi:hypothetical protein
MKLGDCTTGRHREEELETWRRYVATLPWERGQLDQSSWYAFLRGGSLGIDSTMSQAEVALRIKDAGAHPKQSKLEQQIRRAYSYVDGALTAGALCPGIKKRKPSYSPDSLSRVARRLGFEVTPEWLNDRSPIVPWNRSPAGILQHLYKPGERVLVFTDYRSQGQHLWEHPGLVGDFAALDYLQSNSAEGVYFLSNPVDGSWRQLERLRSECNTTGQTRRAEENITAWRYAVLESDSAPRDLWLAALVQLPLPIACITKSEWDTIVRGKIMPLVVTLGADPNALTAVRLTRLGNCRREEKDALQELLYLDPEPNGQPICEKPPRERPGAALARWKEAGKYKEEDCCELN